MPWFPPLSEDEEEELDLIQERTDLWGKKNLFKIIVMFGARLLPKKTTGVVLLQNVMKKRFSNPPG